MQMLDVAELPALKTNVGVIAAIGEALEIARIL